MLIFETLLTEIICNTFTAKRVAIYVQICMLYFHSTIVLLRWEIIVKITGHQKKYVPTSANNHCTVQVLEAQWAV